MDIDQMEGGIEECSYADLLAELILNGDLIITIQAEDVERTKTGIKNAKAKQGTKMKEQGLVIDSTVLSFVATQSAEIEGAVDLHMALTNKAVVPVYKKVIPDKEF